MVFSGITEGYLRILASLVSIGLAVIALLIVWKGVSLHKAGEHYNFLDSFFLDRETMSYSLSKFQLIAWTTIAVFTYIYLMGFRLSCDPRRPGDAAGLEHWHHCRGRGDLQHPRDQGSWPA